MRENMIFVFGMTILILFAIFRFASGKRRKGASLRASIRAEEGALEKAMHKESTLLPISDAVLPMHAAVRELLELYGQPLTMLHIMPAGFELNREDVETDKRGAAEGTAYQAWLSVQYHPHQQYIMHGQIHIGGVWEMKTEGQTKRYVELAEAAKALEQSIRKLPKAGT